MSDLLAYDVRVDVELRYKAWIHEVEVKCKGARRVTRPRRDFKGDLLGSKSDQVCRSECVLSCLKVKDSLSILIFEIAEVVYWARSHNTSVSHWALIGSYFERVELECCFTLVEVVCWRRRERLITATVLVCQEGPFTDVSEVAPLIYSCKDPARGHEEKEKHENYSPT